MYHIDSDLGYDYRVYQPAVEEYEKLVARRNDFLAKNQSFIQAKPSPPQADSGSFMPITGSFIYAHAPDYRSSMIGLNANQWRERLMRLQEIGVDTVIFQAVAWKELQECYYPSKIFSSFKTWDVVTPAMEAANSLNMKFYLGELGSVDNWQGKWDGEESSLKKEQDEHWQCLQELFRIYKGGFQGVYFSSESGYVGERNRSFENAVAKFYGELFTHVRKTMPGLPILISPYSYDCGEKIDDMADYWQTIFSKAAPDYLAPQDSVGTLCVPLETQGKIYEQWHRTAQHIGCQLWSNIEIFNVEFPKAGRSLLNTADVERIKVQLLASRGVAKRITWEMLYFLEETGGGNAALLRQFLKKLA